jgi:hypothetical protein
MEVIIDSFAFITAFVIAWGVYNISMIVWEGFKGLFSSRKG